MRNVGRAERGQAGRQRVLRKGDQAVGRLMLRTGTTSCVDFLFEAPEITLETLEPVVQAYRDTGMRATILLGVADKPFAESLPLDDAADAAAREAAPPTLDGIMQLAHDAVARWHEPDGQIGIGMGPSAPQRCTDALLDASLAFCRERGLAWQTHVLETKSQAFTSRRWHGKSFVERLADRGTLGPQATLVHTVWLSDRDIELMASSGTPTVHCLMSNLRLGDGVARLPALQEAGVRVALGTDGRGCDESLDMLELAKMTALVHKARGGDFHRWPTAAQALDMCTSAASICMGHGERLGRLEEGAHGDLSPCRPTRPRSSRCTTRCARSSTARPAPTCRPWSWAGAWSCATATPSGSTCRGSTSSPSAT